jgi:hypothetical protein
MLINRLSLEVIASLATRSFPTTRYIMFYLAEEVFHGAIVQDSAGQAGP